MTWCSYKPCRARQAGCEYKGACPAETNQWRRIPFGVYGERELRTPSMPYGMVLYIYTDSAYFFTRSISILNTQKKKKHITDN